MEKQKPLKRSSKEYLDASIALSLEGLPNYDEWLYDMREQWQDNFTESEKEGFASKPGPIDFLQYMQEAHVTLQWRRDKDIPERFTRGIIDKSDYDANISLITKLIAYAERALSELSRGISS